MKRIPAVLFALALLGPAATMSVIPSACAQPAEHQYVIGVSGMT